MTTTLEAVKALGPSIIDQADAIDRDRQMPAALVEQLLHAGAFRMFVPKHLGGDELDPLEACQVVEEVSRCDGASGWSVMIGACYGLFGGLLPADAASEIYSFPGVVIAGAFRPNGIARPVEGGYRATGRWPLGSGIMNATWGLGGCRVMDGDKPRMLPSGAPELKLLFFPRADLEVLDTWHTSGLRGTGSNDYEVKDLFVPARRSMWFTEPAVVSGPLYSMPAIALFATMIGSVSLGIGRRAIDELKNLAGVKIPTRSANLLREKSPAQVQVGEAEGLLRSGRAFLFETLADAWHTAQTGSALSWEQRGLLWLAATQAAQQAAQVVDIMYRAGGASSPYQVNNIERCLRDVYAASQHICAATTNYEVAGQMLLGLPVDSTVWAMDNRGDAF
jgi:alkylation response protein AidB-like acyl-CoA dehydrogenase